MRVCVCDDPAAARELAEAAGWPALEVPPVHDFMSAVEALAALADPPERCVSWTSPELLRHVHAQRLFNDNKISEAEWEAFKAWHAVLEWTPEVTALLRAPDFLLQTLLKWTPSRVVHAPDLAELRRLLLPPPPDD